MAHKELVTGFGLIAITLLIGMGNDVAEGSTTLGPCNHTTAGGVWEICTTHCSSSAGYACYETVETEICSCSDTGTFYTLTSNFVDGQPTTSTGGLGPQFLDACDQLDAGGHRCINCIANPPGTSGEAIAVKWSMSSCYGFESCDGAPNTNWDCCGPTHSCQEGGGDCDHDDDCEGNLYCGTDNCLVYHSAGNSQWDSEADCCTSATSGDACDGDPATNWDCCTTTIPCAEGKGDCDFDADCVGNLFCGSDNCLLYHRGQNSNWEQESDCCTSASEHEITAVEVSAGGETVITNIGQDNFNNMFAMNPIVQYTRNGVVHSIYKRISEVPDGFDAYSTFTNTWSSTYNTLDTDFELYDNLEDMAACVNKWAYCNYNIIDVGYPRDCGQSGYGNGEWFSMPNGNYMSPGLTNGSSFQLFGAPPPESTWNDGSDDWATMVPSTTHPSAIDGGWGHWSPYGECPVTCGGGRRNRTRCCDNPWPMNGGLDCHPSGIIMHVEYDYCNTQTCAIPCQWSDWVWGNCSAPCGTGSRTATRNKTVVEENGGACSGVNNMTEPCNTHDCAIDCEWGPWSDWSPCTVTCGGGTQTQNRTVLVEQIGGGYNCTGAFNSTTTCNPFDCPTHGGWSGWMPWTECSHTCGGGDRTRIRWCTDPPPYNGGENCTDTYTECERCNLHPCEGWCPPNTTAPPFLEF